MLLLGDECIDVSLVVPVLAAPIADVDGFARKWVDIHNPPAALLEGQASAASAAISGFRHSGRNGNGWGENLLAPQVEHVAIRESTHSCLGVHAK